MEEYIFVVIYAMIDVFDEAMSFKMIRDVIIHLHERASIVSLRQA